MHDAIDIKVIKDNSRCHVLTVGLEDYFHGAAFREIVDQRRWSRFESRFEKNTAATLELLERHNAKATFFVMSQVALKCPDVVCQVLKSGHEIAGAGPCGKSFRQITPDELRQELRRCRGEIESVTGQRLSGFRVADRHLAPRDLWALEILAEEGFAYDSSLSPSQWYFRAQPWRCFVHQQLVAQRGIWEVPLTSINLMGCMVPIAGGNYFRQFPELLIKGAVRRWTNSHENPFVMYFRVWDLDPEQPRITAAPVLARIRHYRNSERMPQLLEHFLSRYRFTSIQDYLGLPPVAANGPSRARPVANVAAVKSAARRTEITVVVPCFNEEAALPYLSNTLRELEEALEDAYDLRYIFVDDGSTDNTLARLRNIFPESSKYSVVAHHENQGVGAAILTGIRNARTDVVCSIDCDCTYDPRELRHMIPLLSGGVDLVTASPYHPKGAVVNVPGWRLLLSKGASRLYGLILRQPLHTYTSCFRVYRRSSVAELHLQEKGYLGIAELVGEMAFQGSVMTEHPATLETRMLGTSKMRVARTLLGHLRLMSRFARRRIARNPSLPTLARTDIPEPTEILKT